MTLACALWLGTSGLFSAFSSDLSVAGKVLHLNGSGIHTVSFLSIKVYELSLYLEKPSQDDQEIKASPLLKLFRMRFLRELPEEKFKAGWIENHQKRCKDLPCLSAADDLKKMLGFFKVWAEQTYYDFVIERNKVAIWANGSKQGDLESEVLAKYLQEIWIGTQFEAPLRERLLGIKKG